MVTKGSCPGKGELCWEDFLAEGMREHAPLGG